MWLEPYDAEIGIVVLHWLHCRQPEPDEDIQRWFLKVAVGSSYDAIPGMSASDVTEYVTELLRKPSERKRGRCEV